MAVNKSNGLLKIFAVVMVAVVAGVFLVAKGSSNKSGDNTNESEVVYDLSEDEANTLGLTAGDTPHDTLKTLLGALKDTREETRKANERGDRFEQEVIRLQAREAEVDARIEGEVEKRIESRLATAWDNFNRQLDELKGRMQRDNQQADSMPIGGAATGFGTEGSGQAGQIDGSGMRWIEPEDMVITDEQGKPVADNYTGKTKVSFPSPFKAEGGNSTAGTALNPDIGAENTTRNSLTQQTKRTPYYTIAENSTLIGSTAMTALLGRVPIQGAVTDPFPFKVLIGRENLIANGIDLPDVEGAIVSGTSSGDWTLSCVRSTVTSITFVFADGRISNGKSNNVSGAISGGGGNNAIGWLSNPEGVPCIPGTRKTNAKEYLTSQFLLSGAGAAAQGLSQGQVTTVVDGGAVTGAMTGNTGQFVLGQALSGGISEVENWFRQRYGQMFDAIYVPPGQEVAVHITTDLEIDYDTGARKVKYDNKRSNRGMD